MWTPMQVVSRELVRTEENGRTQRFPRQGGPKTTREWVDVNSFFSISHLVGDLR